MKTLYQNVTLITIAEDKPYQGDILVEDKQILAIGPNLPAGGAEVIDCRGLYAIPGLIESHVHIQQVDITGECHAFELYLANGVTAMRNMFGNQAAMTGMIEPDTKKAAEDIEAWRLLGPTLVNTSRIFDNDDPYQETSRTVMTEAMARYYVDEAVREGADQLKVYEGLTAEILDIIYQLGKEKGLKVVGHNPQKVEPKFFYERAFSMEHDMRTDVDLLAQYDTIWVPTVRITYITHEEMHKRYKKFLRTDLFKFLHPNTWAMWCMYAPVMYLYSDDPALGNLVYPQTKKRIKRYYELGREVAAGTDFPNPFLFPGFCIHDELDSLKDCGLTNLQVLRAATIMGAKVLELEHRKGTLEPGKDADIVFLRKNPLKNIKHTRTIERVVARGRRFERVELDELIESSVIVHE